MSNFLGILVVLKVKEDMNYTVKDSMKDKNGKVIAVNCKIEEGFRFAYVSGVLTVIDERMGGYNIVGVLCNCEVDAYEALIPIVEKVIHIYKSQQIITFGELREFEENASKVA